MLIWWRPQAPAAAPWDQVARLQIQEKLHLPGVEGRRGLLRPEEKAKEPQATVAPPPSLK